MPRAIPRLCRREGFKIVATVPGAPADQAGLKPNDIVVSVNGQTLNDTAQFSDAVRAASGQDVSIVVKHSDGSQTTLQLVPRTSPPPNEGPLGITIQTNAIVATRTYPPLEALQMGLKTTWDAVVTTLSVPSMLMQGTVPLSSARPVGPIGISRYVGGAAEAIPTVGLAPILQLMALLSVSLAVVNILPLPGLDGGRLAFIILEAVRGGKRINPQREAVIHFAGIMFFLGLMIVITYFDIVSPTPAIHWGP